MKYKSLLFIDDDEDEFELFRNAFEQARPKWNYAFAKTCDEAFPILEKSPFLPELIILDYVMPKINGKECLLQLKSKYPTIPVVIYLMSEQVNRTELIELGAAKVIVKPYSYGKSVDLIRSLLNEF